MEQKKTKGQFTKKQKEWINHNETIISDNIFHGVKWGYDEKEISTYEKETEEQMREFKKFILNGGEPVFDDKTQMYVIPE